MNKPNFSDVFPFLNQEDIDKAVSELDQQSEQTAAPIDNTAENVQKQVPVIDNKNIKNNPPVIGNSNNPDAGIDNSGATKLSKSEELIKMYKELQGRTPDEVNSAKNKDLMISLIGSLGDNLTTYINAAGEKSAKTGAGVLAGKGGADFASKFATNAKEALESNKLRQEALLKEYQEMTKGERQAATLEAKKLKEEQDRLLDERRIKAYENQVSNSGKGSVNERFDSNREDRLNKNLYQATQDLRKDKTFSKLEEQGIAFDEADSLLDAMVSGNEIAASALGTKMAKAMGEVGVLTDQDVNRYIIASSAYQKALDKTGRLITGKLSKETIEDLKELTNKMKQGFSGKKTKIIDSFVERSYQNFGKSAGLTKDDISTRFGLSSQPQTSADSAQNMKQAQPTRIPAPNGQEEVSKNGKDYKWNPSVGKYQLKVK